MIVLVGLLIAFVIVLVVSRPGTRACRWRADRRRDESGKSFYACSACGAQRMTDDGKPPKTCDRGQIP